MSVPPFRSTGSPSASLPGLGAAQPESHESSVPIVCPHGRATLAAMAMPNCSAGPDWVGGQSRQAARLEARRRDTASRRCKSRYALAGPKAFNLSAVNHSLLIFVHVAKTGGSTVTAAMSMYVASPSSIPCVRLAQRGCDRTDAWRRRHIFLAFHDGRRVFGPAITPQLPALRSLYRRSGGRLVVWTNVRQVIGRTFSHYYMVRALLCVFRRAPLHLTRVAADCLQP
jgi:hypothetical protein